MTRVSDDLSFLRFSREFALNRTLPVVLGFLLLAGASAPSMRTWNDRFGQSTKGRYLRLYGNLVVIERGSIFFKVPIEHLSDEDQAYVLDQVKKEPKRNRGKLGNASSEKPSSQNNSRTAKETPPEKIDPDDPFQSSEDEPESPAASRSKEQTTYPERIWIDTAGYHLAAKLVRIEGDQVALDAEGQVSSFPLHGFSATDREYLKQIMSPPPGGPDNPSGLPPSARAGSPLYPMPSEGPSAPNPGYSSPAPVPFSPPAYSPGGQFQRWNEEQQRRREEEAQRQRQQQAEAENLRQQQQEAERRRQEENDRQRQLAQSSGPGLTPGFPFSMTPQETNQPAMEPNVPQIAVKQYYCSNCKKEVFNPKLGEKCPHCGCVWSFEKDETGKVVKTTPFYYTGIFQIIAGIVCFIAAIFGGAKLLHR
jgi:hypothetical protein